MATQTQGGVQQRETPRHHRYIGGHSANTTERQWMEKPGSPLCIQEALMKMPH